MFSVTMQVILVVRFPTDAPSVSPVVISTDHAVPQTALIASTTEQTASGAVMVSPFLSPGEKIGEARVESVAADRAEAVLDQAAPAAAGGTVRLR
mgnify:CR=1 FL=1